MGSLRIFEVFVYETMSKQLLLLLELVVQPLVTQVKYLGLMENLRVRRAGFAYRRPHRHFLQRYKSLCPDTWPHYMGSDRDGVQVLVNHLNYEEHDYRMGKYVTKFSCSCY